MKFFVYLLTFALIHSLSAAEPFVHSGDRIAFLGDSITEAGNGPSGYIRFVLRGFETNGIRVTPIPAGVSGNRSHQMLARLEKDVLAKKPTWLLLNCGVNNVWHKDGTLATYQDDVTAIVRDAESANVKVILTTFTPIFEDLNHHFNKTALGYNDFIRQLAREKQLPLADLDTEFRNAHAAAGPRFSKDHNRFTTDGVHPNILGHELMAINILRAFGLSEEQVNRAVAAWQNEPKLANPSARIAISLAEYKQLVAKAESQKRTVGSLLTEITTGAVKNYLSHGHQNADENVLSSSDKR